MSFFHQPRWSIFVYVLILATLSTVVGYLLFQTQTTIYSALEERDIASILERNMQTKAERAFDLSLALNTNGSGTQTVLECPEVTLSGVTQSWILPSYHYFVGGSTVCALTYPSSPWADPNLFLFFDTSLRSYTGASYQTLAVSPLTTTSTGYTVVFGDSDATRASWNNDHPISPIDVDRNSDNYRADSSSGAYYRYLSGWVLSDDLWDDDAFGRQVITGFASYGHGWVNMYWPTTRLMDYLRQNPNNQSSLDPMSVEPLGVYIWGVSSGALYLEIDAPADLKIIEYDRSSYDRDGTRRVISQSEYSFSGGAIGFLSATGIIASEYDTLTPAWVQRFDFSQRLYAFFIRSTTGANSIQSQVRYLFRVKNSDEKNVYITPLIDTISSSPQASWSYWANDILLLDDGTQHATEREIRSNFQP